MDLAFFWRIFILVPSIIDIEASGFGTESYPIEIGVVAEDGDRFCWLIKPFDDWTFWAKEAQNLHGISRDILEDKGHSPEYVCKQLNRILQDKTIYSDAWVHDKPWLIKLFYRTGITPHFCISAIENIMSELQLTLWDETKRDIIQSLKLERHRASNDAYIIQRTFTESLLKAQKRR